MFLNLDKTIRRKLQETFLTYRMEHEFTKEQILGTYLNVIFLGQRSYGVAAAARDLSSASRSIKLVVAEAATLAGLPQAPSRYNPITNPSALRSAARYVLRQMLRARLHRRGDRASAPPRADATRARSRHRCTTSRRRMSPRWRAPSYGSRFGDTAVKPPATRSTPRIDGRLQTAANRAVRIGLIEYDRRHGWRGPTAPRSSCPRTARPTTTTLR